MSWPRFDIAIAGAGPAGSAAALRLAGLGCRVALIEATRFEKPRVGESLAPAVQPLLRDLGVWPGFLELRPLASNGTRSVWGSDTPEVHSHIMSPWGCGWHVDRLAFDRMLADAAVRAGAVLLCGTAVVGCAEEANGWTLWLREAGPFTLGARVFIDATGRGARLGACVSARRMVLDRLAGVAVQFHGIDSQREGYVQVEATRDGWWYTAPVPQGRLIAMLMTDSDLCGRGRLALEPQWRARLRAAPATRARLARGRVSWGPRVFSAASHRLRRRESQPWIAVGDAALAVDPISGSGIVRALRTARAGAETAVAVLEGRMQEAIGAYESARDAECTEYLRERAAYYGMERRWLDAEFWRRRAA